MTKISDFLLKRKYSTFIVLLILYQIYKNLSLRSQTLRLIDDDLGDSFETYSKKYQKFIKQNHPDRLGKETRDYS